MKKWPYLFSAFLASQPAWLQAADDQIRRPLGERLKGMFSGSAPGMDSIFAFKYLIYWVELCVILSILICVAYYAHSLNLFKRGH